MRGNDPEALREIEKRKAARAKRLAKKSEQEPAAAMVPAVVIELPVAEPEVPQLIPQAAIMAAKKPDDGPVVLRNKKGAKAYLRNVKKQLATRFHVADYTNADQVALARQNLDVIASLKLDNLITKCRRYADLLR